MKKRNACCFVRQKYAFRLKKVHPPLSASNAGLVAVVFEHSFLTNRLVECFQNCPSVSTRSCRRTIENHIRFLWVFTCIARGVSRGRVATPDTRPSTALGDRSDPPEPLTQPRLPFSGLVCYPALEGELPTTLLGVLIAALP